MSNQAEIAQGDGNRLALVQDGNYNDADIRQGDYHNELSFTQSGDDNRLTVDQNGYGGVISGSSTGNRNSVDIDQRFASNRASVTQNGDDNWPASSRAIGAIRPPSRSWAAPTRR